MKYWIALIILLGQQVAQAQIGDINYLTYLTWGHHVSADLDNDGDLDVIASTGFAQIPAHRNIVWYENVDGSGLQWVNHDLFFPELNGASIDIADITGDGWLDIVTNRPYTLVSSGAGTTLSFTLVENNTYSDRFILGDINGDDKVDLLERRYGNAYGYYLNTNSDGTFDTFIPITDFLPDYNPVTFGADLVDIDQDNDLDMVTLFHSYEEDEYFIVKYENTDGQGTFADGEIIYSQSNLNNASINDPVQHGDLNNDGLTDIIYSSNYELNVLYQQADGTWVFQEIYANNNGSSFYLADFDLDGDLDIASNKNSISPQSSFLWYENVDNSDDFTPHFVLGPQIYTNFPEFSVGDFNGDGRPDFSSMTHDGVKDNGIFIFPNNLNTSGTFDPVVKVSDNINGHLKPFAFNPDQDQDNDLLIYSQEDRNFHWLENTDGAGDFSEPQLIIASTDIAYTLFEDLDSDGLSDVIAVTEGNELFWYKNISATEPSFADRQLLLNFVQDNPFIGGDFDNDGDFDLCVERSFSDQIYWYENDGSGNFTEHLVSDNAVNLELLGFADLNSDGLKDIIFRDEINQVARLKYFQQQADGSFDTVLLYDAEVRHLVIADYDDDLDDDLFIMSYENNLLYFKLIKNEGTSLNVYEIDNTDQTGPIANLLVHDIDSDGKKDFYVGSGWYKQLNIVNNFSGYLPLYEYASGYLTISDFTGDGAGDFVFSAIGEDALLWAENQIEGGSWVEGRVAIDEDEDCLLTTTETGLYGWLVDFEKDSLNYFTSTNPNGYYVALLPDSGAYNIGINLPNNYWTACYTDSLLQGVNQNTTSFLDFPIQAAFDCPLMQVDMSSSNLRPCIDGQITIQYCNEGTVEAENATVSVLLDPNINPIYATHPFTLIDSTFYFEVGNVGVLECGSIQIGVQPDCDSLQVGDLVCGAAMVTPDSLCTPMDSLWDGSNISINGFCLNDSIHFELENTGSGNMDEARQFRVEIVNDDIVLLILVDTFQLGAGETKAVILEAEMDALRIEADQDDNHPLLTTTSNLVSECATMDLSFNLLPVNNGNPFSDDWCGIITGSYDPNIKEVSPLGYGPEHFIDRAWELDYMIHFQNTGNDTAFTVVIKDPISEHLDLSTLKIGGASHPFIWELNTNNELSFTFNNILLPDSTTNEAASHGYVQFSITPSFDVPFGSQIKNRAAIYFDFNAPIITNEIVQTVRTPIIANSSHVNLCEGEEFRGNPVFEDALVVDSMLNSEGLHLDFFHLHIQDNAVNFVDLAVPHGEYFNDVLITQDTIIELVYESSLGCDSIVVNNISVLTSTSSPKSADVFKLFPIPANEAVFVAWETLAIQPKGMTLMQSNGQILQQFSIEESAQQAGTLKISMSEWPSGLYWLKIDLPEESIYKRIVKL